MKPTTTEIKELCEGFGWIDMGVQKNAWMISFKQEETGRRCNIYFTTMSVSCHNEEMQMIEYKKVTLEDLEKILIS